MYLAGNAQEAQPANARRAARARRRMQAVCGWARVRVSPLSALVSRLHRVPRGSCHARSASQQFALLALSGLRNSPGLTSALCLILAPLHEQVGRVSFWFGGFHGAHQLYDTNTYVAILCTYTSNAGTWLHGIRESREPPARSSRFPQQTQSKINEQADPVGWM